MKLKDISINEVVSHARETLKKEKGISLELKEAVNSLLSVVELLSNRVKLNSSNSNKPPSSDPNRKKKKRKKSNKAKGGQAGHNGTTLKPVENPDKIIDLTIDRKQLPTNNNYKADGYTARQIVDIKISRFVTEYRAEILIDKSGNQYIAEFPENITRPIQYGASVKAHSTYLSTYQLIPCERLQEQFKNEYNIPISTGSICNFNSEAASIVEELFEPFAKSILADAAVGHADETGANLNGKKIWLHNFSNDMWTWIEPHEKRGSVAMDYIGIIPAFSGVLCHDHWRPYYAYNCEHSLCNSHHLRELTFASEEDKQKWAKKMKLFLIALNKEVDATRKNKLSKKKALQRREEYRAILKAGTKECPEIINANGKRSRKQSKSRNLLERLQEHEKEILRFMIESLVPFTNNQGERDIRMYKVQQKISGCFRTMDGAVNFCKVRSYLSTCEKHGVSASDALTLLFNRKMPDFVQQLEN